jgi:hypothetical protein
MNRFNRFLFGFSAILSLWLPTAANGQADQPNPTISKAASPANTYNITWQSIPGRNYYLQVSTAVQSGSWTTASPGVKFFVRLRWSDTGASAPTSDYDSDTISNQTEIYNGTDPFSADTDGDGINGQQGGRPGIQPATA